MTKLMTDILNDPSAIFEVSADLPSGNRMVGTVGPMIGDKLQSAITFTQSPASEEDIAIARCVIDQALGQESAIVLVSQTPAERVAAFAAMRKFMGGGQG
jgi:hypothetical protein